MDRTCSGSGLTRGCQPKYPTEVSSTCVRAYFRGVLRIAMELSWPYRCGATGESLDRSRSWEREDPTCRDQRTPRWSPRRGARMKSSKAYRITNTASRSAQLNR
jgi:hypothetical protein